MLFEYEDDDGSTLVWCQGRVVAFIKESIDKHVYVKIEWSDKCVNKSKTVALDVCEYMCDCMGELAS